MTITVFLADDHAILRDGIRVLLEEQPDIDVVGEAADGNVTVNEVIRLCPSIALIDIAMPELNGIDATRQILDACSSVNVIILSMHADNVHVFRALQAGARGYLLKESAGSEVIAAIKAVHNGEHYLSSKIADIVIDGYVNQNESGQLNDPLAALSDREREILLFLVDGHTNTEIADSLSLSTKTVETYRSRLMQKLEIDNLPDLVKFAVRHGLTSLDE